MSTPLLLLHGQPGGAHDWDRVLAALAGRFPTIAEDRPGWAGRSAARGVAGNAEAAIALLDARGVDAAIVVGHSFGGAIACWLAANWPERVNALVLAAPSANAASLYPLERWLAAPGFGFVASALGLEVAGLALGSDVLRRRLAAGLGLDEGYLETTGQRLRTQSTWEAFVVEQRALLRELPALEAMLGSISAPTRIVTGSRDVIVPPRAARTLSRQIPGAELELLERAGHLLPHQHAERLAEIAIEFAER